MNLNANDLIEQEQSNQKRQSEQQEIVKWDYMRQKLVQIQIQIKDNQIIYIKDGEIFKIRDQVADNPEIQHNIEQIKYLSWKGQTGFNNKKNGKWMATWNSKILENVGGYYQDGQKQGLWVDITKNFGNDAKVFEIGEYHNDLRIGKWNYLYNNNKIEGGQYNEEGQKKGKWRDLSEGFWRDAQVTYIGEYNTKGIKIGNWNILYQYHGYNIELKQIGGGSYNFNSGNKFGKWVELWEGFQSDAQVVYKGKYNIRGMKKGRWDIILNDYQWKTYKEIGGGSYDCQQGFKVGKWVELWEGFWKHAQVTYNGEYNMKGIKTGRWDIISYDFEQQQYKQIGGGSYECNQGIKIGKWVEIWHNRIYINLCGEYNMKGIKTGRWDIENQGQKIAGGSYDCVNGIKIGRWIDLDEDFWSSKQVIYQGEYNLKGIKIGRWDILYCQLGEKEYKQIGGGLYDSSSGVKIGSWIELYEQFVYNVERTYNGEYNMQGVKVGTWVEMDLRNNQKRIEIKYDN